MSSETQDATKPNSAYYHEQATQEDVELTHVARHTPGGEYLRRFGIPLQCRRRSRRIRSKFVSWPKT